MTIRKWVPAIVFVVAVLTGVTACSLFGESGDQGGDSPGTEETASPEPQSGEEEEAETSGEEGGEVSADGILGAVVIPSDCARVDMVPGIDQFSVCALKARGPANDGVSPPCIVEIEPSTADCTGQETLILRLVPDPALMHPNAVPIELPLDTASGRFTIDSNGLQSHTIYTATVQRTCDDEQPSEKPVGHFGLCDPSGSIRVITSQTPAGSLGDPVEGVTVSLFVIPNQGLDMGSSPAQHTQGLCFNQQTKPAAVAPPTPSFPGSMHWNDWSGVTGPPDAPAAVGGVPPTSKLNPVGSIQLTDSNGYYGWTAPDGCYYVEVDPSAAISPSFASTLPTTTSPAVADFPAPLQFKVDNLDLTYYRDD